MSFKTFLAGSLAVLTLVACSGGGGTDNSSTSSSQASSGTSSAVSSSSSSSSSSQAVTGEFKRIGNAMSGTAEVPVDFEVSKSDPNEDDQVTYGVESRHEYVSLAVYTQENIPREKHSTEKVARQIEKNIKEHDTYKDSKISEATVLGNPGYRVTTNYTDGVLAEAFVFEHPNGNRYYIAIEGKPEFVNQNLQRILDSWKLQD